MKYLLLAPALFLVLTSQAKTVSTVAAVDKHPWAVYFILFAAALAATASIASSSIAGWVAWKSKDKEFKNDYYKKVVDKRIKAIENVEALLALFTPIAIDKQTEAKCHTYFLDNEDTVRWEEGIKKLAELSIWLSRETSTATQVFTQNISSVLPNANRLKLVDNDQLVAFCSNEYQLIEEHRGKIEARIGNDMRTLYDVEGFLRARFITEEV